jgi:transcription elongation factor GreB
MSRAFVDEDAGADESADLYDIPLPLPPGSKNYMTPEGAARMAAELRNLVEVERPHAAALAASGGTEPGAEPGAEPLRRLAEIDRRISYLTRMGSMLETVDAPASADRVVFGLVVRVVEDGGAEREYRIVGVDESEPERGLLSWASPVARALMGKRQGDLALARLPKGEYRMRILGIHPPPRG